MSVEKIKKIPTDPRSYEDPEGDVRSKADMLPDAEWESYPTAAGELLESIDTDASTVVHAVTRRRTQTNRRGGRSYPEISARDLGRAIDEHVAQREAVLGRPLTEPELLTESLFAERVALGLYD